MHETSPQGNFRSQMISSGKLYAIGLQFTFDLNLLSILMGVEGLMVVVSSTGTEQYTSTSSVKSGSTFSGLCVCVCWGGRGICPKAQTKVCIKSKHSSINLHYQPFPASAGPMIQPHHHISTTSEEDVAQSAWAPSLIST